MKKKLMLLLSLIMCMICVSACSGKEKEATQVDSEIISQCETSTVENFKTWNETDFSTAVDPDQVSEEMYEEYKQWISLQKKLGELISQSDLDTVITDELVTCTIKGKYDNGKLAFKAQFDINGVFMDLRVDEEFTKSQIYNKALLNTLMGLGTVFIVLIMMSLIIGCFKFIGNKSEKQKPAAEIIASSEPVISEPVSESEDVTDDLELTAVITAAIMASMGEEAPQEGLVVRSIHKRNANKWKNA